MDGLGAQVETWARLARVEHLHPDELRGECERLVDRVASLPARGERVLVVRGVDPETLLRHLRVPGSDRPGVLDPNHGPGGVADYASLAELDVPGGRAYALDGFERGDEYRGIAPREAVAEIARRGRTPLTIEEGLAAALVAPSLLERNHCFSLAGSRRRDKRVPALWISAGAPKLGWCWEGAPHDWLGLASVAARIGGTP